MDLATFWIQLRDNVVFLMLVLPLFGAALTAVSAAFGAEAARRTALTNATLTAVLAVVMVVHFRPGQGESARAFDQAQMQTWLPWISGPAPDGTRLPAEASRRPAGGSLEREPLLHVAVGVDGISLWLTATAAWLSVAAIAVGVEPSARHASGFYVTVLTLEGALVGAFGALDVVLFIFCSESAAVLVCLLVGIWGGRNRQSAAGRLLIFQLAAGLLITGGLLGLSTAWARVWADESLPTTLIFHVMRLPEAAQAAGWWPPAALALGIVIRWALWPLHSWYVAALLGAPHAVCLLLSGALVPLGGYLALRILLPIAEFDPEGAAAGWIAVCGDLSAWGVPVFALLALAQNDIRKRVGYVLLSQFSLAAVGILSGHAAAVAGGLLGLASLGFLTAAMSLVLQVLERRYRTCEIEAFSGLAVGCRRLALALVVAAAALLGLPGFSGFVTLVSLLSGLTAGGALPTVTIGLCSAGWAIAAWAVAEMTVRLLAGPYRVPTAIGPRPPGDSAALLVHPAVHREDREPASEEGFDLSRRRALAVAVTLAPVVIAGVWPRLVLDRIRPASRHRVSMVATPAMIQHNVPTEAAETQ